jgi:predicted aldo/keto reductase-like oxidoreductase
MYFEHYGAQKEAMRLYASLDKQADVCTGCDAPCTTSCPYQLNVPERMRGAHDLLSIG